VIPGRARRDGAVVAKSPQLREKSLLFGDIDSVISLGGSDSNDRPARASHNVDRVIHFLSSGAGIHLLTLTDGVEPVSCGGWVEKADEHLAGVRR
jgi:hypothetical protein